MTIESAWRPIGRQDGSVGRCGGVLIEALIPRAVSRFGRQCLPNLHSRVCIRNSSRRRGGRRQSLALRTALSNNRWIGTRSADRSA